ncbi:MAG TPA: SEC-C metal-binding domain-containing protein, partial [Candidatus Dormibacteraeota bacterium]|nr:SEC-C metal-binding domain-containing protein [Candidatus Dormibacteraeota bacterium]
NMALAKEQRYQRGLHYAIVDEVDSILIDEARTPLIISGPSDDSPQLYIKINRIVPKLTRQAKESEPDKPPVPGDYYVDEKQKQVHLSEDGMEHAESILRDEGIIGEGESLYDTKHLAVVHHLNAALRANALYHRDQEYIVRDGEVIIVDEFTGRQQPGRRWSDGLHQAIEAKEGVKVQQETQTLATITYQNYFRLYEKLAGMTGTAVTEAEEFDKIYKLQVVVIPTHKPMIREDHPDLIYKTEDAKFNAVANEIQEVASQGRPVLVGTVSVEKSERLARLLEKRGVPHEVLNAKQHEREALIVANAGQPGAVTIATNMAGRGTDIVLGPGVADGGGLHIVGTERHESRRIDNQLRGRSGRQGDPGSSRFFLALDDDLMRIFGGERIKSMMNMLRVADDEPIESRLVSRQIEGAQTKVEGHNFDARRYLVEYDDVMNKQREIIYGERRKVLEGADLREQVQGWIRKAVEEAVNEHCESRHPDNWDLEGLVTQLGAVFPLPPFGELAADEFGETKEAAVERLMEYADAAYKAKEAEMTEPMMRKIEQFVVLKTIDSKWISYLTEMEHFKEGIGLRAFGQKDPLVEYKNEAFQAFQELLNGIQFDIATTVFRVQLVKEPPTLPPPSATTATRQVEPTPGSGNGGANPAQQPAGKIGRNDPCYCGSGKKYKKCHGR